jgi:hypothetical protein
VDEGFIMAAPGLTRKLAAILAADVAGCSRLMAKNEDATVYGDGVNVAARLESAAETGGVTISDPVRQLIKGKLALELDDLGEIRSRTSSSLCGSMPLPAPQHHRLSSCRSRLDRTSGRSPSSVQTTPCPIGCQAGIGDRTLCLRRMLAIEAIDTECSQCYRGAQCIGRNQITEFWGTRRWQT